MTTGHEDYGSRLNIERARPTVINWQNEVTSIADGYRMHRGIAHGVQKDAVQNAWDARANKRGTGWACAFELNKSPDGVVYLSFTDTGTFGLTGRVLEPEELEKDLPAEERWGRFENVAFTKEPSEEALGSRGRGKFVFLAASKQYIVLYDSLRGDGSYRFGYRTVQRTQSPIDAFDGGKGREELQRITNGFFEPLGKVGTRVIIVEPIEELVEDIRSGRFLRYIGETWWELLTKYKAAITVGYQGEVSKAAPPTQFELPTEDCRAFKVWRKENATLWIDSGCYRVKTLHVVYSDRPVPEDIRGIAIQRGGMKVTSLPMQFVPRGIAARVYGYITVEKSLETALLKDEGIEHYSYDFRKVFPKAVRRFVERELGAFARQKLGIGIDPEVMKQRAANRAEREAVYAINRIARKLNLAVSGFGGGGGNGGEPKLKKPLRIEFTSIQFPRESRRVNYGERIAEIGLRVVNQTDDGVDARLRLYLLWDDQVVRQYLETDVVLGPKSKSGTLGLFEQLFTEEEFPQRGRYALRAKLISLAKPRKGKELHILTRYFYLEEDPPERGLFENCEGMEFPEEESKLMGEAVPGESGGYILQYNLKHPAKLAEEDNVTDFKDYLVTLMANEIPWIDVRSDLPRLFEKDRIGDPEYVAKRGSQIIGEVLHTYYE